MITSETTRTNNNPTGGRTLVGLKLLGLMRRGSMADLCQNVPSATTITMRSTRANQKGTGFYKCGAQGHFKRECPKLKNKNRSNQGGNGNAPTKVYVVGKAGTNPDSNVVTGTFLLNNRYASILFDTGADRSFVSTAFSSLIDITPTTLDHYYDVELADGKIIGINTIIRGCTLNFLNHPFNINLMPVELGSFDVIIGDLKSRGSIEDFVSFKEMITSQLQEKLWLYDEVRMRLCLFCHHQIGEDYWDS
ncbi:putative reverse transcriptase domain-containing protein [Tanacetum coccineum]